MYKIIKTRKITEEDIFEFLKDLEGRKKPK